MSDLSLSNGCQPTGYQPNGCQPNGYDLNEALPQGLMAGAYNQRLDVEVLKQRLHSYLRPTLTHLFPYGKIQQPHFVIGNIQGDVGESLKIELHGPKIGMWHDFATGEGGDILSLWGAVKGLDTGHQFPEIIRSVHEWLGTPAYLLPEISVQPSPKPSEDQLFPSKMSPSQTITLQEATPQTPVCFKDLGNPTGRWYYKDAAGTVVARVYRYDTDKGKEFRPYDVKTKSYKAPNPRPLYNQPGMVNSDTVILVEGEKCAQTLIDRGICATTAMNGANAPLDKTDWSPLKGKHVILWPDHDKPGQTYANRLLGKLKTLDVLSLSMVKIPEDKPESWDAGDAHSEGLDIETFLKDQVQPVSLEVIDEISEESPSDGGTSSDRIDDNASAFSFGQLLDNTTPLPDDWIGPRILTPGGLLVFGGAPKVGKTDLMLNWLSHMAAGLPFLGMNPPRPLKIFYLQTEITLPYLRERVQKMGIDPKVLPLVRDNLVITPQLRLLLNEEGVNRVYHTVTQFFAPKEVDIIAIDSLRNVYDGGKSGSENDNMAMLAFLQDRVEKLRSMLNPDAGIILTHHTKKVTKSMVEEDPFQALSGAASLRSFYSTGMILFRSDEKQSVRQLMFELRNGESIPPKLVDKIDGDWQEMSLNSERLVRQDYGEKLDAERHRRHDVILQLIFDEAHKGKIYTPTQFCQTFENYGGLGGKQTIHTRLSVLATKGYIKFNLDTAYKIARSKYGVMCVEDMSMPTGAEAMDPETGEMVPVMKPVFPTHFKESQMGAILPVENPEVWVYLDNE